MQGAEGALCPLGGGVGGTHTTPYTEGFVSAGLPLPQAGMWGGGEGEGQKKGHKHISLRDRWAEEPES